MIVYESAICIDQVHLNSLQNSWPSGTLLIPYIVIKHTNNKGTIACICLLFKYEHCVGLEATLHVSYDHNVHYALDKIPFELIIK